MGAKSTMNITRQDALSECMRHLMLCDDQQLALVLEDLVGDETLYNFSIVAGYDGEWMHEYHPGVFDYALELRRKN